MVHRMVTAAFSIAAAVFSPVAESQPAVDDSAAWEAWLMHGGNDEAWGAADNERAGRMLRALSSPDYDAREKATQSLQQSSIGVFPLLVAEFRAARDLEKRLRIRKIAYERFMSEACPWFNDGFMGIQMQPREDGMMIMRVLPGTSAEAAGLQQFDVIVQVGQTAVHNDLDPQKATEDFAAMIATYRAGDNLELTLVRSGQFRRVTLSLGRRTQRYIRPEHLNDLKDAEETFETVWSSLVGAGDETAALTADEPASD